MSAEKEIQQIKFFMNSRTFLVSINSIIHTEIEFFSTKLNQGNLIECFYYRIEFTRFTRNRIWMNKIFTPKSADESFCTMWANDIQSDGPSCRREHPIALPNATLSFSRRLNGYYDFDKSLPSIKIYSLFYGRRWVNPRLACFLSRVMPAQQSVCWRDTSKSIDLNNL